MKVSTRGRYALRMMIDVARQGEGNRVTIKEVSERQSISVKYLEQIVKNLVNSGFLRSIRGSHGGYMLARKPEEYTAGEILRAIEGSFAPVACLAGEENRCERREYCETLMFWSGLGDVIDGYLDRHTLADFVPYQEKDELESTCYITKKKSAHDTVNREAKREKSVV